MHRVQPSSLGDAYPALGNFLKLTSLTLTAPQLAMTVQVGDDWRHGGVMNYGQLPAATLREVLSSQPVAGTTLDSDQLSLTTYSRSPGTAADGLEAVLVGRLHHANARYHFTLYVPGLAVDSLSEVQIKTLQYLAQQLLLCLTLAQPMPPPHRPVVDPVPPPVALPRSIDYLSRVVALSPAGPTANRLHQGQPRLVDLVAQLQACLTYRQLGQLLATYLPHFFPHESGRLVLFSAAPEKLTVLTEWGDRQPLAAIEQQCCYPQIQLAGQQPAVGHQCHQCHQCEVEHCPTQTSKCIVLGMINQTTCVVQLVQIKSEPFNPVQTALLKKLSEQILFVMQRLLLLEDLQDQALKDPLTGLLNRRHAETVLNSLCTAANGSQNISIILIDIDHFKSVNDTYGHQAGDAVLKNIGMLLRGHVRSQDIVCRYGGEEFCMVLLDTTPEVALKRAEKIRRAVKYITNSFDGQMLPPLTISLGVASFPHHGQTPHTLVTLADKALYWAKNHGRDRAVTVDHMLSGSYTD